MYSFEKFKELIDKCLWGGEADEDLHVLAKINLIMHGDGYNNIYQGDSLSNNNLPDDKFNLVLTNPPFTIPYTFENILEKYEVKEIEALDKVINENIEKSYKTFSG